MRFDEVWIGEEQLTQTAALAASTSYLDGEVVEIGAWQGLSTVRIANAVAPAVLHVVDHWQGGSDIESAPNAAEMLARDNYAIFLANMGEGTAGNYEVHKMDWRDWARDWDRPIRFMHLDAAHTTEEVEDNLRAVLPFMAAGSIVAGDDGDWPTVEAGVTRVFPREAVNICVGGNKLWWTVIG